MFPERCPDVSGLGVRMCRNTQEPNLRFKKCVLTEGSITGRENEKNNKIISGAGFGWFICVM
jgi:hypothetical protein